MKFFKSSFISAILLLLAFSLGSCVKEELPDNREKDYGYVQFKLYKAPQTKSGADDNKFVLLKQARKIRVKMVYEETEFMQTLTLSASSDIAAEFGLRSQKLQLASGSYELKSYELFNEKDVSIYFKGISDSFDIIPGGMVIKDLTAAVPSRGSVRFRLVKSLKEPAQTKSSDREYTFDEIKKADITVKDASGDKTSFTGLKTRFSIHFDSEKDDQNDPMNDHLTSSLFCDTLLYLPGGDYTIESYVIYDKNGLLERNGKPELSSFTIEDNITDTAAVKISLNESAQYLKDYYALKEIWIALGGDGDPDQDGHRDFSPWYYAGENFPKGCNWNFDKDPDLWGDQPGVQLHANGRVAVINISDFGFRGAIPDAIGQLTELAELYLGTHNDLNLFDLDLTDPDVHTTADRMTAHKQYFSLLHPATPFSEPIARALMEKGIDIPEIAMYKTLPEDKVIDKATGEPIIRPLDTKPGKICNGLTGISEEIGKLKKLEKLFIANGLIEDLPASMENLKNLTDIELYNCSKMKKFPEVLAKLPSLVAINMANNNLNWSSETIEEGFRAICNGPSKKKIQIWYMGYNNMTVFPKEINNLKSISLLDLSFNKISKIESLLGTDIKFVNLSLSFNQITDESWPETGKVFFGFDDLESLSLAHNKMETFPNVFTTKINDAIQSVDLSFNNIHKFPDNFNGINVETLVLANNPNMKVWPDIFAKTNSLMYMINLRGCGIEKIEEDAFVGKDPEVMASLMSLDLSYNHLKELPEKTMHSGNLPYLYGVDVSYNSFSSFPRFLYHEFGRLTILAIRGQRDGGKRCLSEWPDGYSESNLLGLYLGSNDMRKVEGKISHLCYNLDIADNPNLTFDATDICDAIQAGVFILIYDRSQNILNCPILLN